MASAAGAIDAETAARAIARRFPELADKAVTLLGEGWGNRGFLVDGAWVARFPKSADAAAKLARERALLERLAWRLPVAVPAITLVGEPDGECPFGFAAHRRLPGEPGLSAAGVDARAIGTQLGGLIRALHDAPVDGMLAIGVRDASAEDDPRRAHADAQGALARLGARLPAQEREMCLTVLAWPAPPPGAGRVIAHRDLHGEHVCLAADRRRVLGVFDWGDAAVSDPAVDFAAVKWLGVPCFDAMAAAYGALVTPGFRLRVALLALRQSLWDIGHGVARAQEPYVIAGRAGIAHCGALARALSAPA